MALLRKIKNYKPIWKNAFWTLNLGQGYWVFNKSVTITIKNLQGSSRKPKAILGAFFGLKF